THALQPCDFGVFGPLATHWAKEVSKLNAEYIAVDKYNLLKHYSSARDKAFKVNTIKNAFCKTGMWPLDP
ncbi:hypothetical protein K438DRAFT_1459990, partial [Mycena galopus ATCC 62051]